MLGKANEIVTVIARSGYDYEEKRAIRLDEAINVVLMDLGETEIISIQPIAASFTDGDGLMDISYAALITCRMVKTEAGEKSSREILREVYGYKEHALSGLTDEECTEHLEAHEMYPEG